MRKLNFFLIILLTIGNLNLFSQTVENVDFNFTGNEINIYYDIEGALKCDVEIIFVTQDGETIIPQTIKGDVGKGVKGGKNRKAVWYVFDDRSAINNNVQVVVKMSNVLIGIKHNISAYIGFSPARSMKYQTNFGCRYGYSFSRFGIYASIYKYDYQTESDDGIYIYTDEGNGFYFIIGPTFQLTSVLKPYIGIGIGDGYYESIETNNSGSSGSSSDGIMGMVEIGTVFQIKKFIIDIGIPFDSFILVAPPVLKMGVGYSF